MFSGVMFGLGAASSQAASYIFSRRFSREFPGCTLHQLACSHVWMGGVSILLVPWLWPDTVPAARSLAAPLIGTAGFYLVGQAGLFLALRHTQASRVSPLLGLKVFILALISAGFLHESFTVWQWSAIGLSGVSTFMLNRSGGRLPAVAFGWAFGACLGYALSDLHIRRFVGQFEDLSLVHAAAFCVCLTYAACGVLAVLIVLLLRRRTTRRMWSLSVPFAVTWILAMLCLFACFGAIGVVFGNVILSARGLISILLGSALVRCGVRDLEVRVERGAFWRRLLAAAVMSIAIAVFCMSSNPGK